MVLRISGPEQNVCRDIPDILRKLRRVKLQNILWLKRENFAIFGGLSTAVACIFTENGEILAS